MDRRHIAGWRLGAGARRTLRGAGPGSHGRCSDDAHSGLPPLPAGEEEAAAAGRTMPA